LAEESLEEFEDVEEDFLGRAIKKGVTECPTHDELVIVHSVDLNP
jgi:hypothetical protein